VSPMCARRPRLVVAVDLSSDRADDQAVHLGGRPDRQAGGQSRVGGEDVALLIEWLRHDIFTVAGPCYADRCKLYDFVQTTDDLHNLLYILGFGQEHKTNWHLTTWTDCAKRT
jgi:hypothetical protein